MGGVSGSVSEDACMCLYLCMPAFVFYQSLNLNRRAWIFLYHSY